MFKGKNKNTVQDAQQSLLLKRRAEKRRRTIRKTILSILLLAAVLYGIYTFNYYQKNERWPWVKVEAANPVDSMVRTTVRESKYTTEIDLSGYVQAIETQEVKIRASGAVAGVYVKEGDQVTKGQLLAEIDSTSAKYNVANLEWQLEKQKINANVSARDLELMEMQLASARQQLENTKAYANFDGTVVSVSIQEGDYFDAGKAVMTIIDGSKLKATVEVDEIDVQKLTTGMEAVLTADSAPGQTIKARVSYIPMIGRYSAQGIGVMDVEIIIDNPPAGLKPGFSFEGSITTESENTMLLVSQSAVTTSRGSSTVTKLLADGTTQTVPVQVRYLGENTYQIVSGDVADGDTVVYERRGNAMSNFMLSMSSRMGGF